jgi:hypothetical protein
MTSTALPQLADIQVKCMVKKCLQAGRDGSFAKATFSQIHKADLIALVFHMAVRGDRVDGSAATLALATRAANAYTKTVLIM